MKNNYADFIEDKRESKIIQARLDKEMYDNVSYHLKQQKMTWSKFLRMLVKKFLAENQHSRRRLKE